MQSERLEVLHDGCEMELVACTREAAQPQPVLEANASRYHGKAPEELDWSEKQRQTRAVTAD